MLDAIAAVFLGMTMSRRGEPKVVYTLVGVLILRVLDNGMTQLKVDSYVREIFVGLIVLAAVAVASLSNRRNAKSTTFLLLSLGSVRIKPPCLTSMRN